MDDVGDKSTEGTTAQVAVVDQAGTKHESAPAEVKENGTAHEEDWHDEEGDHSAGQNKPEDGRILKSPSLMLLETCCYLLPNDSISVFIGVSTWMKYCERENEVHR